MNDHNNLSAPAQTGALLDVPAVAAMMNVSESWVRRHTAELPAVRLGRLVRFDANLLLQNLQQTMQGGKSLKSERSVPMPNRFQQGSVRLCGTRIKTWYGMYREDVRTPEGQIRRRQRNIRLGTLAELPTKSAARKKLADLLFDLSPKTEMTFSDLADRWEKAEGPTMKASTLAHYTNALRAYVRPKFDDWNIKDITRESIQLFLADKAEDYSLPSLRSMRVVLGLTLGWAENNGWLDRNPCSGISLPRETGGRKVKRTALSPEQVTAIASKLEEPYATLVLFLYASGLRIGEAIAVKWSDFQENVLDITRRIYDGEVGTPKSEHSVRSLPIQEDLLARMKQLGGTDWVFCSRGGTPVNPGNALKRYIKPIAKELSIALGGWHDFRHSLTTQMRRNGVHPKVISAILGHSKVDLAMNVYDRAELSDFQQPLTMIAQGLVM